MAAISPISAFGAVQSISGVSGLGQSAAAAPTASTGGFSFSDALAKVQGSLDQADELSRQLATGQLTDVHDFTVAANKAQLAVQLTVALRNQALSAFQEIMRMQI